MQKNPMMNTFHKYINKKFLTPPLHLALTLPFSQGYRENPCRVLTTTWPCAWSFTQTRVPVSSDAGV